MTAAEKSGADRLAALHAQLTQAVEDLAGSDAWHRMLQIAARMPTYSPSNVLLIAVQRPDATRVAGFGAWKQLGRNVLKGEKGIAILAPCLYRGRADDKDPNPPAHGAGDQPDRPAPALRGFRIVHVFDVSQTDGQPLPDVNPAQLSWEAQRPPNCGSDSQPSLRQTGSRSNAATATEPTGTPTSMTESSESATTSTPPKPSKPSPTNSDTSAPTTEPASPRPTTSRADAAGSLRSKPSPSPTSSPRQQEWTRATTPCRTSPGWSGGDSGVLRQTRGQCSQHGKQDQPASGPQRAKRQSRNRISPPPGIEITAGVHDLRRRWHHPTGIQRTTSLGHEPHPPRSKSQIAHDGCPSSDPSQKTPQDPRG